MDQALTDLRRLAALDLGDNFSFVYSDHRESVGGQAQPYVHGYSVTFELLIGVTPEGSLEIDLATRVAYPSRSSAGVLQIC